MYNVKSLKAEEFISDEEILDTLAYADANKNNVEVIDAILAKARERVRILLDSFFVFYVIVIDKQSRNMYNVLQDSYRKVDNLCLINRN